MSKKKKILDELYQLMEVLDDISDKVGTLIVKFEQKLEDLIVKIETNDLGDK